MPTPAGATDTIIQRLDTDRAALLAIANSIPAERCTERPRPECWSIAEVLEHVANVDTGVARMIARGATQPLTATAAELEAARLSQERASWVRNRETRVQAPERVRPTGRLTMEQALGRLAEGREGLKQAYLAADPAVLDGAVFPHPILGSITVRGWVELTAHHDARHAKQIAEIVADLSRPRE